MSNYPDEQKREGDNYQEADERIPAVLPPKLGESVIQGIRLPAGTVTHGLKYLAAAATSEKCDKLL